MANLQSEFQAWRQAQQAGSSPQLAAETQAAETPPASLSQQFNQWRVAQADGVAPVSGPTESGNGTALGRGFARGLTNLDTGYTSSLEGLGALTETERLEEYARLQLRKSGARAQQQAAGRQNFTDIEGFGDFLTWAGEAIGEQAPLLGVSLAGGAAGAAAGAPLGPLGALGGAVIGGTIANFPLHYGFNREAQKEEAAKQGLALEVDEDAAILTAIPQSALDYIVDRFLILGKAPTGPLLTRVVKGGGQGVLAEVPTEVGQEILQRMQAGADLTSEEAISTYVEVAAAAGLVGGVAKSGSSAFYNTEQGPVESELPEPNAPAEAGDFLAGIDAASLGVADGGGPETGGGDVSAPYVSGMFPPGSGVVTDSQVGPAPTPTTNTESAQSELPEKLSAVQQLAQILQADDKTEAAPQIRKDFIHPETGRTTVVPDTPGVGNTLFVEDGGGELQVWRREDGTPELKYTGDRVIIADYVTDFNENTDPIAKDNAHYAINQTLGRETDPIHSPVPASDVLAEELGKPFRGDTISDAELFADAQRYLEDKPPQDFEAFKLYVEEANLTAREKTRLWQLLGVQTGPVKTRPHPIELLGLLQDTIDLEKRLGIEELPTRFLGLGIYGSRGRTATYAGAEVNTAGVPDQNLTARHEAIHVLASLGVFDTAKGRKVWDVLVEHVKSNPQGRNPDVVQGYHPRDHMEEEIAELWAHYDLERAGAKLPGNSPMKLSVRRALGTVSYWYESVKAWVRDGLQRKNPGRLANARDALELISRGGLSDEARKRLGGEDYMRAGQILDKAERGALRVLTAPAERKQFRKVKQIADFYNLRVKWGWTISQLQKKNRHIEWLNRYVEYVQSWHGSKTAWTSRADTTVRMWSKLTKHDKEAITKVIFELEDMKYLKPGEKPRLPTRQELQGVMLKHKLTREGVKVYIKVVQDFRAVLDKMEATVIATTQKALANSPGKLAAELNQIRIEFAMLRNRPYFPHTRLGRYTLVAKDSKGKTVYLEAFDSEKERDRALPWLQKKLPQSAIGKGYLSDEASSFAGMPPQLLVMIQSKLNLTASQKEELETLMVQYAPGNSFKQHLLKRDNVAGYSKDAMRVYADYFFHSANHLARLEWMDKLSSAIQDGKKDISIRLGVGQDMTKRTQINDFLIDHLNSILDPKPDWAWIRAAGFLWYLGFNVKSAVINLTQLPLVTMPHLSAQFGDVAAMKSMTKAMTKLQKSLRDPHNPKVKLTPYERKMLIEALEQGFIDESFAQHLAMIAESPGALAKIGADKKTQIMVTFSNWAGFMFAATEKVNRATTFMAALDLAQKMPNAKYIAEITSDNAEMHKQLIAKGFTSVEASQFLAAKDAVNATQFQYASWARPRFMRGKPGTFFTFFMYVQNMLWFVANNPGNTRYLITLLLMAGLSGLPFADDLTALSKWVGRKFAGEQWDPEKELREAIINIVGEDGPPPDLFINGVGRYGFGLEHLGDMTGLPIPALDLSGNLSMGSPLPIVSPAIQQMGRISDWSDMVGAITQEGAGASWGIGFGAFQALADDQMAAGDPKRWERAMPIAVAQASKAFRYWQEGRERRRDNSSIVAFNRNDPEHMAEIAAQAIGFRPTRLAQAWDQEIAILEAEAFWRWRRSAIYNELDQIMLRSERTGLPMAETKQELAKALRRFNSQVPYPEMKVSYDRMVQSIQQRRRGREVKEAGAPRTNITARVQEAVQRLHPETPRGITD